MQNLQMHKKLKVLIGDNSVGFGVICGDMLSKSGIEVSLVNKDGVKVIEGVKEFEPDVVVMESFMAQMDAINVMKNLNQTLHPAPKFIIISGYDNKFIEQESMNNGASYYMLKPFEMSALCDTIKAVGGILDNGRSSFLTEEAGEDLEAIVTDVILHIGIPAHIKGYHYIRRAIMLSVEDTDMINSVTKLLYPTIAKEFGTTSSRVERAIRHAIEIAWDRGDVDTLNAYFGYTINTGRGKPTNSEFIAMISDKLRLRLKKKHTIL